ncbi:MAG: 4-hydroxyphenylacetate 3-hydroxylase N-terminal domain-containing protein [Oscillospiraceae bacterium]
MALRTKQDYLDAMYAKKDNLYYDGKLLSRKDPRLKGCFDVMAKSYDLAQDGDATVRELFTATSHVTGEVINRFNHIHQSTDDLHKKQDMTRYYCNQIGTCCRRCMGIDAANAINAVAYEAQKRPGARTQYYDNFLAWLKAFQQNDWIASGAQTDVKGERLKRPGEQTDPDSYVHKVDEDEKGIYVTGAKVHISEAVATDEILVFPTRALVKGEEDYAVAFSIPSDSLDMKQIVNIHPLRERKEYKRGFTPGYSDSYLIFDRTFIPWENVYLCGETDLGGILALLFALFHRHSYSGCKPAVLDYTIGMASLAAEINGISKTKHVKKALADMIMIGELGYAAGYTASDLGKPEVSVGGKFMPFGPGAYIPHVVYANVGRCLSGENVWHELEMLCDIAGGFPATFPYENDILNPETKPYLEKYLNRNPDMPIDDQIKFWLTFVDSYVSGNGASSAYGQFHGGGSPIMEQIAITSQYDIGRCEDIVRRIAGMSTPEKKKK